uniref:Death domain-containing protein n=2 Tax=Clytia hemisphaerica TaxID=252671 RepID=A0A7M5VBJ1_9CNID
MATVAGFFKLQNGSEVMESQHLNTGIQKQTKRTFDQAFLKDTRPIEENELDDIAEQISRSWRHVGRKLNITESSLNEIDLRTGQNTEREKAFQMLLEWRERFPDDFNRGSHVIRFQASQVVMTTT